ncbi:EAL domain-containing protein [Butyrivibrio sp. YAB3001]|uniref:EAL domain-containing protein n=1 Tax=Butyrivibrio sp. YAB3001 TaxID=1520812 RepID=UPI0008F617CF|nr:EAL domain-containing protein [Butyrivibrio sp. YAB3001]SFB71476.1 PAS domain S-box-containing protein [Butyrivibrio sp. YAB3001]
MENMMLLSKFFDALAQSSKNRYIFVCDIQQDIWKGSKNMVEQMGLPSDIMVGGGVIWGEHIHPDDRERFIQDIADVFSGKTQMHDMVYRAKDADGEYVVCSCFGSTINDENGNPLYFVGTIDNHGIANEFDAVTGLFTKEKLLDVLRENREAKQKYNVLFIGILNFTEINNVYGYDFGNKVLKEFANHLFDYPEAEAFQAGGTKFALVSSELSFKLMKQVFEELVEYGRHGIKIDGIDVTLVLGGSYTEVVNFNVDERAVYTNGIRGLGESMKEKHGELQVFSISNLDKNHERIVLINALRNSINNGCQGFSLVFQPIVDSVNEEVKGAEALVRWSKDPFGSVPPEDFIAWLEDDPIFYDLGLWIFRTAMKLWKEIVLPKYPEISLSINVSYMQLERQNFRKDFMKIVRDLDFPVDRLFLELTEKCRFLDKNFLRNEIIFFKSNGIGAFIDDFGTGFSALELLLSLPVSGIKIDKSFVKGIENDERKKIVASAIIKCAKDVGVTTTVEGIESAQMRDILSDYDTAFFQGFLYSQPVSIEEYVELPLFDRKIK